MSFGDLNIQSQLNTSRTWQCSYSRTLQLTPSAQVLICLQPSLAKHALQRDGEELWVAWKSWNSVCLVCWHGAETRCWKQVVCDSGAKRSNLGPAPDKFFQGFFFFVMLVLCHCNPSEQHDELKNWASWATSSFQPQFWPCRVPNFCFK